MATDSGGPRSDQEEGTHVSGEAELQELGYRQELKRSLSVTRTVALAVSDITPVTALLVIAPVVLATAGGAVYGGTRFDLPGGWWPLLYRDPGARQTRRLSGIARLHRASDIPAGFGCLGLRHVFFVSLSGGESKSRVVRNDDNHNWPGDAVDIEQRSDHGRLLDAGDHGWRAMR